MKLSPDGVMSVNLLCRIILILYLLKESYVDETKNVKPLKYRTPPLSKRVFLILLNGLQEDFLKQNSTPYLRSVTENLGAFGVALTRYMQTNTEGLKTILSGRYCPTFPYSLLVTPCHDSILDYVKGKCAIGQVPEELDMTCDGGDGGFLESFQKFTKPSKMKKYNNSLYILSLNLDPIWAKGYQRRLKEVDDDIRYFASVIDSMYVDNETTYIVTSARGSPVGQNLSTNVPVIAWGSGITKSSEITYMRQGDLTALLCVLLGVNFPSKLFGIIPFNMIDLDKDYINELALYNIWHFEKVLKIVDTTNYLVDSTELEMDQANTRLNHIIFEIRKSLLIKVMYNSAFLILLLTLWSVPVLLFSSSGFAYFFCPLKSSFFLLLAVGATITYSPSQYELPVMSEMVFFWICQNSGQINDSIRRHGTVICQAVILTFTAVTLAGVVGNQIVIPSLLVPLILWPVINGTYRRLNRFVLVTRLLTGITLGVLPFNRVFGEKPDMYFINTVSVLFLINFYTFMCIFKRDLDTYTKINFFMICTANVCFSLLSLYQVTWLKHVLSCLFLIFFILSVSATSGTLFSRLFKVFLSLFIPVLMLSIKIECVFYFYVVFHLFTWIFIEYHSEHVIELQYIPPIFSIEAKTPVKSVQFSKEDKRHIVFFITYCYLCYFAIGHNPDLHSYDLYVIPTFVYDYPTVISYFLSGLKFFLPFFLVTLSFMTICVAKKKDFNPLIMISLWLSDVIGCCLVFYSQFFNLVFERDILKVKFPYFFIQQFGSVSVILSRFIGKQVLLGSSGTLIHTLLHEMKLEH